MDIFDHLTACQAAVSALADFATTHDRDGQRVVHSSELIRIVDLRADLGYLARSAEKIRESNARRDSGAYCTKCNDERWQWNRGDGIKLCDECEIAFIAERGQLEEAYRAYGKAGQ